MKSANPSSIRSVPRFHVLGFAALFAALGTCASASDWTQFRGENAAGIAPANARPATTWSDSKNLKWQTPLPGPGTSSPIVPGDRVFVTCYSGYGDGTANSHTEDLLRHVICVDRSSGKILWNKPVPATLPEDYFRGYLTEHGYASSTPVTDGERVYVFFGKTGALAFDFDGRQLWKVHLGSQSSNRRWGSAASPVLYRDKLIVNAAEEGRAIVALDKLTGKILWKAEAGSLELSFGTPVLAPGSEGQTDIVLSVPGEMWGLNPDNGKLRWFAETGISGNVSPSVVVNDGVIFATGGYPRQGNIAVRAGGRRDVTDTHVVWTSPYASYVPTPVAHEGNLLVVNDQGFAMCIDQKTGKLIYKERVSGATGGRSAGRPFYASPVLAGDHLYAVSRRNGVYILQAGSDFEVIAHNRIAGDDSDFNATPAIAGRQLFLRSNRNLYCIEAMESAGTK